MNKRFFLNIKKGYLLIKNLLLDFVEIVISVMLILFVLIVLYLYEKPQGFVHDHFPGLLVDLIFFGVLIVFFAKLAERRRDIKRWKEEIDDYRHWDEKEALYRIIGIIRRLNARRVYKINLDYCYLEKAHLSSARLTGTSLANANLREADLQSANLEFVCLDSAILSKANLNFANLSNSVISDASFCGAQMYNANLKYSLARRSQEVNFSNASLESANFFQSRLSEAFFIKSSLTGAIFERAYLWDSVFRDADISRAIFTKATLIGIDFSNANLRGATFSDAILKTYHEELSHGGPIHLVTKFTNAILESTDFRSADLQGVVFTNAKLKDADFRGATNLSFDQLKDVETLFGAKLDPTLENAIRERKPALLKGPVL